MKKSLFILGAAAMMFAGCAKENVTNVAENRAINFDSYVYNNTKAVTEVTALNNFYVFGEFGDAANAYGNKLYNNEVQSTQYYWAAGKHYIFGAYADGEGGRLDNATFDATTGTLTFPAYTANDAKDLLAAVSENVECTNPAAMQAVALQFKHMLSQVKFTFNTVAGENLTLSIFDLKVNAVQTADGTYTTKGIEWAGTTTTGDYVFTAIDDLAIPAQTAATKSKIVIPQNNTTLEVSFSASVEGAGITPAKTSTFKATLNADNGAWKPGFRYNYTATINPEQIDPALKDQIINFNPTVETWQDAAAQPTTPTTPTTPAI